MLDLYHSRKIFQFNKVYKSGSD